MFHQTYCSDTVGYCSRIQTVKKKNRNIKSDHKYSELLTKGPDDCRSVSLTSVYCEIMKSVMGDAVTSCLTANNLIEPNMTAEMANSALQTWDLLGFREAVTTGVDREESGFFFLHHLPRLCQSSDKVLHQQYQ
jgi:hypothetical protein